MNYYLAIGIPLFFTCLFFASGYFFVWGSFKIFFGIIDLYEKIKRRRNNGHGKGD